MAEIIGSIALTSDDKKKLKIMLSEITQSLARIDNERLQIKDIATDTAKQFGIPKKLVNKLASTMYKHNFSDVSAENAAFESLYETLIEASS